MTLGEKLRFYRTAQDVSQQAVARQINRSRATYTYYEAGKIEPSIHALYRIARFLGVQMEHLADEAYIPLGAEEFLADPRPRRCGRRRKSTDL